RLSNSLQPNCARKHIRFNGYAILHSPHGNGSCIYPKDLLQEENGFVRKGIKQEVEVIIVALKIECDVFA
ncbi:hypothetical protein CHH91_18615, partial [Virgibacillus sp. 7505]|uniref:hypothetical protein n=1 Tax=Virgibacillus sp. 7505 TaxID=2022548 RepID=UPI000BD2E5CA